MNGRPVAVRYEDSVVAQGYDQHRFQSLGGRYKNWRLSRLVTKIVESLPPGSTVLDIPCGTGRIDNWLLKAPVRVVAADISRAMLGLAQQKVRLTSAWLGFLRADANHLPFRSGCIDGVFCIRFVHLLDRQGRFRVLNELVRIARRWVVIEYRVERPIKATKRAIIRWLTGRTGRKKMAAADIADELKRCGLVAERYYFISRWFSGSVLVKARRQIAQSHPQRCRIPALGASASWPVHGNHLMKRKKLHTGTYHCPACFIELDLVAEESLKRDQCGGPLAKGDLDEVWADGEEDEE